ncbi:cation transporter, partial [Salmonella enterica subsp. enterica serovar Braenderup]
MLANLTCLALLTRFRGDDVNMRSVWLCSRNDVIGNVGVLLTTGLIVWTGWPLWDLIFGALLAVLFARTGMGIVTAAWPIFRART